MKARVVFVLLLIAMTQGCTSRGAKELLGNAAGNASNTQMGYDKQCFAVKSQCVQGLYEEWETSDGVPGCSCKKL